MLLKQKLQFVIPIFNEEECVEILVRRLIGVRTLLSNDFDVDFIFVNDGSNDTTLSKLVEQSKIFPGLVIINFSKNFGHQVALTAGLDYADADYVVIIDGDLQDPPELVVEMLSIAKKGYDVVYGQRTKRDGETLFKTISAHFFYRIIVKMCQVDIPKDTGDFRLINKKVLMAFRQLHERHRFIRGMVPWLGFKSAPLLYHRDERYAGETKFPVKKMIKFALDAIFSFSNTPLRFATYSGIMMVLAGFSLGGYMLYLKLVLNTPPPGITLLLLVILMLGGFQVVMLGLIGEYIGRIFEEVKGRPLYILDNIYKSSDE
jgi:dolichol-phosphate mannosyltransferase